MNLYAKAYWSNNPIPVNQQINNPDFIINVPIGVIVGGSNSAVQSVNGKIGVVVLDAADVGAATEAYVNQQISQIPSAPVTSVNTETGDVVLTASDFGAPTITYVNDQLDTKANSIAVTQALSTKADLVGGVVPANQLPSFVNDVLEYASLAAFPVTGEASKIYIALDTNKTYRWGGSSYVEIGGGVALGETAQTAYRGDRGKIAYDHSLSQGNPHNTTTSEITEGTNKYFTDLRVRNTVLTGLVKTNSSNVTNTDTVEVAVGKLAAKSEAGGSGTTTTWVDISTLNGYYKHRNISTVNTKIEVAKIGGMLWVRGYITTTDSIAVDTEILSFTDNNYRWDNTFYTTFDYNLISAKTTMHDLGIDYSLTVAQVGGGTVHKLALRAGQNYSDTITKALIQPVCVGKHY